MKKFKFALLALMLAMIVMVPLNLEKASATQNITVAVNGKLVNFPDQQPYIDGNARTLVPVRFPAEVLGAKVSWEESTSTVTIDQAGDSILPKAFISLQIGNKKVSVSGKTKTMDTTAILTNGRTMVPIRFVSEYLGAEVKWWDATKTVHVFTLEQTEDEQQKIMEDIAKQVTPVVTPGQKVWKSDELKIIYGIFQNKGYKVGLRSFPNCVNDYGVIDIYSNKSAANINQYDQDVYEQVKAYIGTDAAEWVRKMLNACENPEVTVVNQTKVFGDKSIAVYMYDMKYNPTTNKMEVSDEIIVEFIDDKGLGR